MGKSGETFDRNFGKLVLLALHRVRIARIVFEHAEIEFGDKLAGRAVPVPKQRLDQTAADHLFDQAKLFQHLQGGGMGGRGARRLVDLAVCLEHAHRQPLAGERQRRDDADRAAAGNEDRQLG